MIQSILGMLNYGTLLFFGVFVSASFMGIYFTRKNIFTLLLFSILSTVLQLSLYLNIGYESTQSLYPLISHLPLVMLYVLLFKQRIVPSILAVTSAYLCCQLGKWIAIIVDTVVSEAWVTYTVRTIVNIIIAVILIRFASPSLQTIFTKPRKALLTFGVLPLSYYIFDYGATVYTNLLYVGNEAVFEFLPFMFCVAYLLFCMVYFREYEEKLDAERRNQLLEMQRSQSAKEIESIERSEYAVAIIRHDMRHFLNNLSAFINNGETQNAQAYINEVITLTDNTASQKYCSNKIINMIISSYENEMVLKEIDFRYSLKIPSELPFSDVDLTSILSNALENAIHAVSALEPSKRRISLSLWMNNDKLLLSIENPYAHKFEIVDGLPQTDEAGHGIGTQSIRYVAEKLNGNCQFTVKDDVFILRVVL